MNRPPSNQILPMKIRIAGLTDQGMVRDHNEDDYRIAFDLTRALWGHSPEEGVFLGSKGALMVVADGMGGAAAGEVASRIAVEEVKSYFSQLQLPDILHRDAIYRILERAFSQVHDVLLHETEKNEGLAGMGTTLTIGWFLWNQIYVAWVGDSRAYLYNRDGIVKTNEPKYRYCTENLQILTDDHSLVWERVIQSDGKYTPEDARLAPDSNVILRCLGHDFDFKPPQCIGPIELRKGDQVLLCTDGLNGMISDTAIDNLLNSAGTGSDLCSRLIDAANRAGGKDNITVIHAEIVDLEQANSKAVSPTNIRSEIVENTVDKVNSKRKNVKYRWILFFIVMNIIAVSCFIYFYLNQSKVSSSSKIGMGILEMTDSIPSDTSDSMPSNFRTSSKVLRHKMQNLNSSENKNNINSNDFAPIDTANESITSPPASPNPEISPNAQQEYKFKPYKRDSIRRSVFLSSKEVSYKTPLKCKINNINNRLKMLVERKNYDGKIMYKPHKEPGYPFFACNEDDIELDLGGNYLGKMNIEYKMTNGLSNEIFIEKIVLDDIAVEKVRKLLKAN